MQEGVVNDDYSALLDGVETLLPIGLMQAITRQFRCVSLTQQNNLKPIIIKIIKYKR